VDSLLLSKTYTFIKNDQKKSMAKQNVVVLLYGRYNKTRSLRQLNTYMRAPYMAVCKKENLQQLTWKSCEAGVCNKVITLEQVISRKQSLYRAKVVFMYIGPDTTYFDITKETKEQTWYNLFWYNSKGPYSIEKQHSESGTATIVEPKATRWISKCDLHVAKSN
jgi:hypothetical protein